MNLPPLSTLLVSAGLALFSVFIVEKARGKAMFRKATMSVLVACAVLLFGAGLVLHLTAPLPGPHAETVRPARVEQSKWRFSFEPKRVRWGEEVCLTVIPETEDFTVYFNGRPLPKKVIGKGTAAVTIPANSRSGRFSLDVNGTTVESGEQLMVTME